MVDRITPISADRPLINDDLSPSSQFLFWANKITRQQTIIGTGNPDGVIEAVQGTEYMNENGTAGAIKYIKRDDNVGGDKTLGWVLI